jgi:hypothetical protein
MNNNHQSWYKKNITSQNNRVNDVIDWVDDDTSEEMAQIMNPEIVDFDAIERQRAENLPLEQGEMQTITEEEIDGYIVDDLIEQDERYIRDEKMEQDYFDGKYIPSEEELKERGIEPVIDDETVVDENPDDAPEFGEDHISAMQWAIENNRVVKLSYLTLGKKRGRGGKQHLKREISDDRIPGTGVNIWRIVEPHYIYPASNGHDILISYDRSVRHIRAFRVSNVTGVEFTKKRSTNEPSYFKPRVKIKNPDGLGQSGKIKGIEAMNENIFQNLKEIGDDLVSKGLSKNAESVTKMMSHLLNIKTAQYVGPQGYWIRQKRCWDNCYRHKRTTSPEKAAQTVWMECRDEYNEAINNNSSGWEKYAEEDADLFKYASKEQEDWVKEENKKFAESVDKKITEGKSHGMSICLTLEQRKNRYNDILIADADNLSKIAETLKETGQEELSEKIATISIELLKKAQFGGGFEGAMNKLRKYNPFSSKSRAKGHSGDVMTRLKNIAMQADNLSTQFNTLQRDAAQYGQEYSQEQQSYRDFDQQQQAKKQQRQDMWGKVKDAPGQTWNALKQKGQEAYQNFSNPPGQALSESDTDIKEAQYSDKTTGVVSFIKDLRSQLEEFMTNLATEKSALSQISAQSTDTSSRDRAAGASVAIEQFITKANQFISSTRTVQDAFNAIPSMVEGLSKFSNDINMIQRGETPPIDSDRDGVPDSIDVDNNQNMIADEEEIATPEEELAIPENIPLTSNLTGDKQLDLQQLMENEDLKSYLASLMGMYNSKMRTLKRQQAKEQI